MGPIDSAQRLGFFNIGSGIRKIWDSGSGLGWVGALKNTIGYFTVSFLLMGISGNSWVFSSISEYLHVDLGILDNISFYRGNETIIKDFSNNYLGLKILQKITNNLQI